MFTTDAFIRTGLVTGAASFALSLYLLLYCRRQKKKLTYLTEHLHQLSAENSELQERLQSIIQPQFVPVGISLNESINRIDIKVQNTGAAAVVEKVVTSTPDIEFLDDRFFPLRIESDGLFVVTGLSKGMPLSDCRYVVQLHYSDTHGNHYLTAIRGEGQEFKITTAAKI